MNEIGDMGHTMRDWFEIGVIVMGLAAGLFIGWLRIKDSVIGWINTILGKDKKPKKAPDISIDKNIHEHLNRLRYESDACRVKLFQYHNGGSFSNGKSMKKLSMTHESCHPGMVPTFKGSTDMILSLFVDLLEASHENFPNLINTGVMRDSYFKSYLQSNHVLMFSVLPIKNTKGEETGCLICEWCAWEFADSVQYDGFSDKFIEARNSIEYLLSTERKK
jgi:hypothetical protein